MGLYPSMTMRGKYLPKVKLQFLSKICSLKKKSAKSVLRMKHPQITYTGKMCSQDKNKVNAGNLNIKNEWGPCFYARTSLLYLDPRERYLLTILTILS